ARLSGGGSANQLEESALLTGLLCCTGTPACSLLEELVPRDRFQRAFAAVTGEVDAQHAGVVVAAGLFHRGRVPAVILDPLTDFLVVGRRLCCACHDQTPCPGKRSARGANYRAACRQRQTKLPRFRAGALAGSEPHGVPVRSTFGIAV